ncbi:putative ribosomal protein S5/S7 [Lupinus albus]|uniref:Putative ribosomal protein S5/S7 n=1 Tax=Lupinus albus TaxID=3870 RepID=A0A6A4NL85_LUPAL|nr:putative ribosomal protein S5/S7 [Lupinus albus]
MADVINEPFATISNPKHLDVKLFNRWSFDDINWGSLSMRHMFLIQLEGIRPSDSGKHNVYSGIRRSGPRKDATRIGSTGVVRRQAEDISPLRRVNHAI